MAVRALTTFTGVSSFCVVGPLQVTVPPHLAAWTLLRLIRFVVRSAPLTKSTAKDAAVRHSKPLWSFPAYDWGGAAGEVISGCRADKGTAVRD
jgi:hypothetical protein